MSRGFIYHDGGPPPLVNIAEVLFRNGNRAYYSPNYRWNHTSGNRNYDIVGYWLATPGFDPTKPVQTRDGKPARILATDLADPDGRTVAVATLHLSGEALYRVNPKGRFHCYGTGDSDYDLINVPITRTYGDTLANSGQGVNVTEVDGVITEVTPV